MLQILAGHNVAEITMAYQLKERRDELPLSPSLPIKPVSNTFPDVLEAARVKAQFPLSYADAFLKNAILYAYPQVRYRGSTGLNGVKGGSSRIAQPAPKVSWGCVEQ